MNILWISPLAAVALVCVLLLTDLDTTRAQLTSLSESEVSSGTVFFPEDDDEIVDESSPPLAFRHPPNGRREPSNAQSNSRFPHPVNSFLKPFEPLFNGVVPNFFNNPEPNFNIHHHYNQHGGNFHLQGPPSPLPPPQQIPSHLSFPGPPVKRPPHKNSIKFPSDLPPGNHFSHDQRPTQNTSKRPKTKPTVNRQFKGFFANVFQSSLWTLCLSSCVPCCSKHLLVKWMRFRLSLHSFISSMLLFGGDHGCGFLICSAAPVFSARLWVGESEKITSRCSPRELYWSTIYAAIDFPYRVTFFLHIHVSV